MFFNNREFVRGSDGRIYEIRNPDAEGGIFFFFVAIFLAILSAIYAAYMWLLAHYFFVASMSLVGFITWTGWVYHEYQQKEGTKQILYKIISLAMIFAGFSLSISGYKQSQKEADFRKKLAGEWHQVDANIDLTINSIQFIFKAPEENIVIEAYYTSTFDQSGFLEARLNGKLYKGPRVPSKAESYNLVYQCSFIGDQLRLWNGTQQRIFKRK